MESPVCLQGPKDVAGPAPGAERLVPVGLIDRLAHSVTIALHHGAYCQLPVAEQHGITGVVLDAMQIVNAAPPPPVPEGGNLATHLQLRRVEQITRLLMLHLDGSDAELDRLRTTRNEVLDHARQLCDTYGPISVSDRTMMALLHPEPES